MRKFGLLSKALPRLQQKSIPVDYASFMNELALARKPSALRELMKNHATASSDVVFIGEGLPHPETMPFDEFTFTLKDGTKTTMRGSQLVAALTYQPTQGYPPLVKKLQEFMIEFHAPPRWEERDVIATVGAQDGLSKVLEMSLQKGDAVVVANPTYSGLMSNVRPFHANLISASFGRNGFKTKEMRDKLTALWSARSKELKLPKLMYLTPTANNPSGHVMTDAQKQEVYDIACEFNLLILEDDPYYFINFEEEQPKSLLSMDTENRVIRLDTFSKIFSGGLRTGILTGPKEIVRVVEMHMQASVLHTSSLSQMLVLELLNQLGWDGFRQHAREVRDFYRQRRDQMCALAEKYLRGLADWEVPGGGMFLWVKVKGVKDVLAMVMERGLKKDVMLVPGHAFMADPSKPCPYIRLSYSVVPMDDVEKAMQRLSLLIKEEQLLESQQ